jgi:hypothetical protein
MGNKKGEIKKSRDIFRVKGGMIICGLVSFFTFSESRKPETAQFLIVNISVCGYFKYGRKQWLLIQTPYSLSFQNKLLFQRIKVRISTHFFN